MSSQESPVQVCVAGCGHWGKNLVRNFHELGALGGVYDSDVARTRQMADQFPGVRAYPNYDAVLADPAVNGVVIATPAEQHASMGIAALSAGKDAFIEKPLALTPEDGESIAATARAHGRILMVGHLLMYHPAVSRMQELLSAGELGRLEYVYSNRLSMGKIRREENALWSFAPHDLSVILALTGHLPLQVTATGGAYLQPNIADVTVSNLLFDHGARAHVFVSWLHPYKEQRLVVIGSRRMIVFEDSRATDKLVVYDKQIDINSNGITATPTRPEPVPFDPIEPLRRECEHFLECIANRRQPATPGENGIQVLQVLQACQRSLDLNGEPVRITGTAVGRILPIG